MTALEVTSVNSLLYHASTCFRIGSKFRCIRSTPTEMQSISENDFECFASTGVNTPEIMFPDQAFSTCHDLSRTLIELPSERSQSQANYNQANQATKIWNEPDDGDDQQAHQQSQQPIAFCGPGWLQKYAPQEGSNPKLRQVERRQIDREQNERDRDTNQSDGYHDYGHGYAREDSKS